VLAGSLVARRVVVVVDWLRVAARRVVVAGAGVSASTGSAVVVSVATGSEATGSGAVSGAGEAVVSAAGGEVSVTSCAARGVEDKASTAAIAVRPERACFTV